MKKHSNRIWILLGVVALAGMLWFGLGLNQKQQQSEEEDTNWNYSQGFDPYDSNPYGTFVLKELMDTGFAQVKLKMIKSNLDIQELRKAENAIYLFVGHQNFMDDAQVDELLEFVAEGSTALLSFHKIPYYLEEALFEDGIVKNWMTNYAQSTQFIIGARPSHLIPFVWENDTSDFDWNYFEMDAFFSLIETLGTVQGKPDFIKIKYGKGAFLLHLNPYVFTNINLFNEEGLVLAEEIFNELPKGDVYWDIYSTTYNSRNYNEKHSVIEFILNNESLKWAFITLLLGVVIFGIFASKRYFKAIPIVQPNKNTSLEFVETISRLYRRQGDNSDLLKIKKENFQNFVSHHYFIQLKEFKAEFIFKLSQKSNIEETTLEKLVEKLESGASNKNVTNEYLIETHKMLEEFYLKCTGGKKTKEKTANLKDFELKLMRKSTVPLSIIGGAIGMLFIGLIFLTLGLGLGSFLILIGLLTAIFGYLLFATPIIYISEGKLTYKKGFKALQFDLKSLEFNKYNKEEESFELVNNKQELRIDLRDLSIKDQNRLINGIRNLK